jgi:hypothetical protein
VRQGDGPLAACSNGGGTVRACRWATLEVWLHPPEVVGGDVPTTTTDRQVCLRCGAARLVRALDGRVVGDAAAPQPAAAAA